ncbi:hypothetical protein [Paraburkholderia hospita]|uniref:hypothetical protein n=1 Tax=Paraburkholderia hospita TaxID=169430 RepID=UPI0008A7ED06|nr:hypothetical protein [Paraburkholderia hospita]SEI14582.1 hypothetical protein SAMN05192544_102568 [Paraburkholderia hospita]
MSELNSKIGFVAGMLVRQAMNSGLAWDEAVAAFGLAAKAAAQAAASAGDGSAAECVDQARMRFEEAFAQDVRVVVVGADMQQIRDAYADGDADRLLANGGVKHTKLH